MAMHTAQGPRAKSTMPAPFRWSSEREEHLPVRVEGTLPEWLKGQLVRLCPAVFDHGAFRAGHWFDGLALAYAFEFGAKPSYRQHLLESAVLSASEQGRTDIGSFDTRTNRSLLSRLFKPVGEITDNANVNVIPWQGDWLAMTESPHQHLLDGETLHTRGEYAYDDELSRNLIMTAHPHFDRERNALVNLGSEYGPRSALVVYRQSWASHAREEEGRLQLKEMPYVHSFGFTQNHVVIIDHPFRVNPLRMLFSNRGFIEHFRYQPKQGMRLWKFDRSARTFAAYETDARFCFHTVNTFEDKGGVVMDFLCYDDPSIVSRLRRAQLALETPDLMPRLLRARLVPGKKHVTLEELSTEGFDFPQVNYRMVNGKAYEHVWGTAFKRGMRGPASGDTEVVHVELARDRVTRFSDADYVLSEPVMVARPGATSEADGVLLSLGSHRTKDQATLFVLDAATLEPLARCQVDTAIPLGFHGNFGFSI